MKIFVVVDWQVDFIVGALGFEGAERLDSLIANKVREAKEKGYAIYHTLDTHYENYLETREGKQLPIPHCIRGTDGWQVFGETRKVLEEVGSTAIEKHTFGVAPEVLTSIMFDYDNVEAVEFAGLVTNMCVVSNVVTFQAKYPNAQMIVHANLVDSFDKELHNKTLDVLRGMQVEVID